MPQIEVNQVSYYYERHGDGEPLVLLHGFTGSSSNWVPQMTALSRHFKMVAVDLLGHGRTESPSNPDRYQMAACAADVVDLLEQIVRPPFNLLGYSMGGRLALYIALERPDLIRRLVLESASPGLEMEADRHDRVSSDAHLADSFEQDGVASFVRRWEQIPLFASQQSMPAAAKEALRRRRLRNSPVGLANSLRGMGTGRQPSLWPRLGEISFPVMLLAGELDNKFVAINQRMASVMDARLEVVPGAGHTIHLEQPTRYNELLSEFLT